MVGANLGTRREKSRPTLCTKKERKGCKVQTFNDAYPTLLAESNLGIRDWVSTVEETIGAYSGGLSLKVEGDGEEVMTKGAAAQLFGKIGLPVTVLDHFRDNPELQRAMVQHKLSKVDPEARAKQLICRGRRIKGGGTAFDSFLSEEYVPLSNVQVIQALRTALDNEGIDAQIHRKQFHNRNLAIRLITPEWQHDLGGGDMAYTAVSIRNDELGKQSFSIKAAVARIACFNYTVAEEPIFEHAHRYLMPDEILKGLREGFGRLNDVAAAVSIRLADMRNTDVEDVAGMLRVVSAELGIPEYARKAAQGWWEDSGATPNLFWLVQAVSFGVDEMTSRKGFAWDRREMAEQQIFHMAQSFQETGKLELCECPRCHRPMARATAEEIIEADYAVV